MQRHFGGHGLPQRGRLRAAVVIVAAFGVLVAGALPALAADSTPPALVSFSRTSPASVSPGQSVMLAYSATDDSSGVASVVFHFTDTLGNDRVITGSGGGPTTATAVVDSTWTAGAFRLDEIDVTDNSGNTAKYIAGATSFNLDSADFTVTGTVSTVKPAIRGVLDRTGLAPASWLPVVNGYVVQASWAALQPTQGGDIAANNVIDQAIAQARTMNAQNRGSAAQPPIRLKLRVFAGDEAPDWAKNLDGTPVTVKDANDNAGYTTVGRFWTANFATAYQDFMTKLAAKYDGVPEVRDVVISRCTLTTAEPFLRITSDQTSVNNLIAAGFTVAADHLCHQQQVDVHKAVWQRTTSSVAFTPYQSINPDGTSQVDESWTETMIDYCRQQLGSRCVLESNSIKDPSVPRAANYPAMYAKIASLGPPIAYQTASPNNGLGSLCNTLGWAVSQGTGAVELPQAYVRDGVSNPAGMASYDKALEGVQPPDTSTPTAPSNLTGAASGSTSMDLTWRASSDTGYGVACYTITRGGSFLSTTMNTTYSDSSASPSIPTNYAVTAVDGAGHTSGPASATLPNVTTTTSASTSTTSASTSTSTTRPTTTTSTTRPGPHLSVSPTTTNPGSNVTATWSGITSPTSSDWIGMYANSSADNSTYLSYVYTTGTASGSVAFPIRSNTTPGNTYELRLFSNNGYTVLAKSAPFTVTTSATTTSSTTSTTRPPTTTSSTTTTRPTTTTSTTRPTTTTSTTRPTTTTSTTRPTTTTSTTRPTTTTSTTRPPTTTSTTTAGPHLSVSPTTTNPGSNVTATWSGIASPTSSDWIGLFANSSAGNTSYLSYQYTTGAASGSLSFPIPSNTTPGNTYELRLFSNNGYTVLAKSAPFTVTTSASITSTSTTTTTTRPPTTTSTSTTTSTTRPTTTTSSTTRPTTTTSTTTPGPHLSVSPTTTNPGSSVTATWSGIANPTSSDWIGLYATSSDGDTSYLSYVYTTGTASGSVAFPIRSNLPPGTTYELRLFSNNGYTVLAVSAPFTVT